MCDFKEGSKVSYCAINMKELTELIDKFVDSSLEELFVMDQCKDIIIKFEKLRGDYI